MAPLRVLVTGGSRGIGRAIALRFAREGALVSVAARSSDALDAIVKEIEAAGGKGNASQTNVRDHGSVEAAVWRTTQFTGGALDVLVNCAGAYELQSLGDTDQSLWDRMVGVNLSGPFYVTREAQEALEEGERPHVFNVAAAPALLRVPNSTAVSATKAGLRAFGDALRAEWRTLGIRVSTVLPGPTRTGLAERIGADWPAMNEPEDVAAVVWDAYHAADDADVADLEVPPPA
jgi:NAD(P)-dependent dehydrogenase (short-subunit alcohol dehydrogenase family)